jgi:hypothetical protein
MNLHPICALVIASLMVPAVALALMADRALAAEPQMPEYFKGTWCSSDTFGFRKPSSYYPGPCPGRCYDQNGNAGIIFRGSCVIIGEHNPKIEIEIAATEITTAELDSSAIPMSCVVRQVTKFDVCPWGMIFKNRERARALRSFQINPWGPGYHIVLQCTNASKRPETIRTDWVMEKGNILVGAVERSYRCPWDKRSAR